MVNPIIFVGGIFLAMLIYFAVYIRLLIIKRLQMIDWFLLSLATFNGLGFAFVFWATNRGYNTLFWQRYINMYDNFSAMTYLISSFLLGLSCFSGWTVFRAARRPNKYKQVQYRLNDNWSSRYKNKITCIAWIMLVVAVFSYALYSKAFGGFAGLLKYSILIRSGVMTVNNPFSFLQKFGSLSFVSSFIFFGLLIDRSIRKYNCRFNFLGYVLSFGFSIYVLYSLAGRVGALIYIFTFLLGYILYNHQSVSKLIKRLVIVAIVLPISLIGIDSILGRSSKSISLIELFAKELSFPFASYIVQFDLNNYRLFKDIIVSPLFLLPQRIWSEINIEVASSFNTFLFMGARKGEAGVTGSIPVDMLTFANMQASIIGIIILGLLWGGVLHYSEVICNKIQIKGVQQVIYANLVLNVALLSVLYGDPQHIIIRNFAIIIGILLIMISAKFKLSLKK